MASTILRTILSNDSGSPANPVGDGTTINNALFQTLQDAIDEMFSGAGAYTTFTLGGHLTLESGKNLTVGGGASVGGTLGVTGAATVGGTLAVTGASTFSSTALFASSDGLDLIVRARASDQVGAIFFQNSGSGQVGFLQTNNTVLQLGIVNTTVITIASSSVEFFVPLRLTAVISPPTLTTDQNDYSPTGLSTASVIRIDASGGDGNHNLTGLAAQSAGQVVSIVVTAGALNILAENGGSVPANRFGFQTTLAPASSVSGTTIWYDVTSGRWRQLG